jgi:hypothetical protein
VPKPTEIFTPNDQPTYTYVDRAEKNFERLLRDAMAVPNMIVSISGPSKSGKSVLVKKVVDADNLIVVSGATIKIAEDLWSRVLSWMDTPSEVAERTATGFKASAGAKTEGSASIIFARGTVGGSVDGAVERRTETTRTTKRGGLPQVIDEIAKSDFVVLVDDFHYIPKDVQVEVGKQIKAAAEMGVRIITASVPHRADDVVRSNPELRGRVTAIDTDYWSTEELVQIAYRGFRELNVELSPAVERQLAQEAFGSPQLMQSICLTLCFEMSWGEELPSHVRVAFDEEKLAKIFERTSTTADYSTLLEKLHRGPRQRGTERREFALSDGSNGDVYRCILLAIAQGEPRLSLPYDQMMERVKSVCLNGQSPVGSSVSEALLQMHKIVNELSAEEGVLEWDDDVLDISAPYFLFFIRRSDKLLRLAKG